MLYQLYETQRSLMEPFADFAQAASKLYSNPLSPLSQAPMAQRVSAGYDLLYRLGKDYEKPVFGITTVDVDGVGVAIHERVEIDKPFCELRRFKRFSRFACVLFRKSVDCVEKIFLKRENPQGVFFNAVRLTRSPLAVFRCLSIYKSISSVRG